MITVLLDCFTSVTAPARLKVTVCSTSLTNVVCGKRTRCLFQTFTHIPGLCTLGTCLTPLALARLCYHNTCSCRWLLSFSGGAFCIIGMLFVLCLPQSNHVAKVQGRRPTGVLPSTWCFKSPLTSTAECELIVIRKKTLCLNAVTHSIKHICTFYLFLFSTQKQSIIQSFVVILNFLAIEMSEE